VKEPLRQRDQQLCIHTKNIFSLIDLAEQDSMYDFLINHEKKCTPCAEKLKKFREENFAIKVFVPKPFLPKDLRETFNHELADLFKIAGLNEIENKKKNIKAGLLSIDQFGENIINTFVSKKMLKAYIYALLAFVSLKYFL
jgi:hypothetical protein